MPERVQVVGRPTLLVSAVILAAAATWLAVPPFDAPRVDSAVPPDTDAWPLAFEENVGQLDAQVRFVSRGPQYTQFITERAIVWRVGGSAVFLEFPGSSPFEVIGTGEQNARSHYLRGRDPAHWVRDARQFSAVRLSQLYAGIDLVLYGSRERPEYDFIVAPQAQPGAVRLKFSGAERLRIGAQGELIVRVAEGELVHHRPMAYQRDARGHTRWVEARFVAVSEDEVRFELGTYDPSRELVIDPVYEYSTFIGGTGTEILTGGLPDPQQAIFVNGAGEVYAAGVTNSADFPTTAGVLQPALSEDLDFFIVKLNAAGDAVLYSTYIGGTGDEVGVGGIHVNTSGEILFAGVTQSDDFPTTIGAYDTAHSGGSSNDVAVLKLNAAGDSLVYSSFLGGTANERLYGFGVASDGGIVVAGSTFAGTVVPFPVTAGALNNGRDQFITRFTPDGAGLAYSAIIGAEFGVGIQRIRALALDASDNVYLTGTVSVTDMPVVNALDTTLSGGFDGFVAKLNPSASAYLYSTYLGGANNDEALAIAVDATGAAYVAGTSVDFPTTPGTLQPNITPNWNGFLAKLAPGGNAITWATYVAHPGFTTNNPIALDAANRVYLAMNANVPLALRVGESPEVCLAHTSSPSVVRISADGTTAEFGMRVGGPMVFTGGSDISSFPMFDLAVDSANNVYIMGGANSPDFPTYRGAQGARAGVTAGGHDAYVVKLSDAAPVAMPTLSFSAATYSVAETAGSVTVTVNRSGRAAGPVKIRVHTNGGSATAGVDYTSVDTVLEWRNGDSTPKTVAIPIASDAATEGAETVNLSLADNMWCLGDVGAQGAAVLTIDDNSAPPPPPPVPGTLQLSASNYSVAEGGGNATVTVTRGGGSDGAVGARLATSNGTAGSADYTATDVIVSFAAGDAADKTVSVPIAQDTADEPDETVTLTLSAPTGGASLGAQTTATLTITDDDPTPAPPAPPASPPGGGGGGGLGLEVLGLLIIAALRFMRRPTRSRVGNS